jgi:hypothetical protein
VQELVKMIQLVPLHSDEYVRMIENILKKFMERSFYKYRGERAMVFGKDEDCSILLRISSFSIVCILLARRNNPRGWGDTR